MQRALLRGVPTAEAARYALERMPKPDAKDVGTLRTDKPSSTPLRFERLEGDTVRPSRTAGMPAGFVAPSATTSPLAAPLPPPPADVEHGAQRIARRLSAAALAMDARAMPQLLAAAIAELGVLDAWEHVIQPVLAGLGKGTRGSGAPAGPVPSAAPAAHAEVGYLFTECVFGALVRATPVLDQSRNLRPVLVGCVPAEVHTLPVYVVAAALTERRIVPQLFGVPLPADVLAMAVRRSMPAAVVLWAERPTAAVPRIFERIAHGRQRGRLFAGGPGWAGADLPAKVEALGTVQDVIDRVEYVLIGGS